MARARRGPLFCLPNLGSFSSKFPKFAPVSVTVAQYDAISVNCGLPGLWVQKQRAARFMVPKQPGFICGLPENIRS